MAESLPCFVDDEGRTIHRGGCGECPTLWKVIRAIYRGEPWGHVSDLWAEFRGHAELRGKPPNQYLLNVRRKSGRL